MSENLTNVCHGLKSNVPCFCTVALEGSRAGEKECYSQKGEDQKKKKKKLSAINCIITRSALSWFV